VNPLLSSNLCPSAESADQTLPPFLVARGARID
jgi:hypothetical protein